MENARLFVLQVVIAVEHQWLSNGRDQPATRTVRQYGTNEFLYAASDEEAAFEMARDWLGNDAFSDSNHDGPWDLTRIYALGIHQLTEVARADEIVTKSKELYGIGLPGFWMGDVTRDGIPAIREKHELEVFRLLRIFRGTPAAT